MKNPKAVFASVASELNITEPNFVKTGYISVSKLLVGVLSCGWTE